ncbi:MAG: AlkA N-terminal domain-containing protein [Acidimicrobiales bacterium]
MSVVGAVTTTGIYCRPGCGGRPKPSNRRTYPSAAAAEAAGFRACLVCRPYRDALSIPWDGPDVVCRAVSLILDGALDRGNEPEMAARLGVSDRHLRRLFAEHVGATPDEVARSSRAHFARRLLDDTDLTVAEIAFATGFGSIRQFNRVCQEVFRFPPSELRRRRRRGDRLVTDGGLLVRLPFRAPLDWDAALGYLAERAVPGVERVEDGTYRRTADVDGDPAVLEFLLGGADHLLLRLHLPHWEGLMHIVQRARRVFNLDAGARAAAKLLERDPVLGGFVSDRPGARAPGTWDPFESGVQIVLAASAGRGDARQAMAAVVERLGRQVPGLGPLGLTHVFPGPAAVASCEEAPPGVSPDAWRAARAFAQAVSEGTLWLDGSEPLDSLLPSLAALRGWDRQSAEQVAYRIGEPDAFPSGDPGLLRSLSRALRRDVGSVEAAALAQRWSPVRAHAAAHLIAGARPRVREVSPEPAVPEGARSRRAG